MATWHSKLKTASWRGVTFGVLSADLKAGRRTATHEFPGKDRPFVEDLGGKAATHSVEAFVVGDDYMTDRDALIDALQQAGQGTLIHPYLGEMVLQVTEWSLKESTADGGMAVFSIAFAETSEKPEYPKVVENKVSEIYSTLDATTETMGASAVKMIDPRTAVSTAAGVIRGALSTIKNKMTLINAYISQADAFAAEINDAINTAVELAKSPALMVSKINNIFSMVATTTGNLVSGAKAMLRLYSQVIDSIVATYYTKPDDQLAQLAVKHTIGLAILGTAVKMASYADYETLEQAETMKETIFEKIESILLEMDDDATFQSVLDVKILLSQAVPPEGAVLKNIVRVPFNESVPSLVASWSIFGDVIHEAEIISRNNIRHPAVVGGAQEVEVLK